MDASAFPLSAAQRSRWFLYRLQPARQGDHNNVFACELRGRVDTAAFAGALARLARRHAMLRAAFGSDADGVPYQHIAAHVDVPLADVDASALADDALHARVAADARAPFDVARAPLLRAGLYRRGGDSTVFMLALDHLVCDGWSYWRLLDELGALLEQDADAAQAGGAQYRDFVAWQRDWLASADAERQYAQWAQHLDGDLPVLALPADRRGQASGGQDIVTVQLDGGALQRLRALAGAQRTTLFATLLAGYQILLHRHAGQDDVVVGAPMPGRTAAAWDGVVGDFVNMIALRTRFDGDPTVADLLHRVRQTAVRGMARQDYPFAALVERLPDARAGGAHPLFQTVFAFHNARSARGLAALWNADGTAGVRWGGFDAAPFALPVHAGNDRIGLTLQALELDAGLRCDFVYDAGQYDRATIVRIADGYRRVLELLPDALDVAVGRLPLLTADERMQLAAFNATARALDRDATIHALFERTAARHPDAIALVCDAETLSYAELNRRANRVAHRLRALGVRPDDRVALCVERSPALLIGVLGILKAGGAYLPLDPAYPRERLAYLLADGAPVAVATTAPLRDAVFTADARPLLLLDDAALTAQSDTDPDPADVGVTARHLAYVIYTSGSTGRPKGVLLEHAGLVNLALAQDYGLGVGSRALQFSSIGFDAATWDWVRALTRGATLHLCADEVRLCGERLAAYLVEHRIEHALLPPAVLAQLDPARDYALRSLIVGGDACDERLAHAWARRCTLYNAYGPTEATVAATQALVVHGEPLTIGRPLANTQVHILDPHGQPVPVGVVGELHIGGAGVARGYLHRDELTAAQFIADPFADAPGARLYRTGDLGRWRADGTIEFRGRNDAQVKIRGFRIEPGEIEARLCACTGVREAAVIAREDRPGDKRLVAYVVPQPGHEPTGTRLRQALARDLADYLLPAAFVVLQALPLTTHGKLDRRALPAPDQASTLRRAYAEPQGGVERTLAALWQELLGIERVGRDDHFFELGGHSLLAVQLAARMQRAFGVDVPLREMFAQPTVAALAAVIARSGTAAADAPIPRADRAAPLPLSSAQQRLWFIDRLDRSASVAYHVPAALELHGALDRAALAAAFDRIVARHESLRTTFADAHGAPVQVIAPAGCGMPLRSSDLSELPADQRDAALAHLRADEAQRPFDLAADRLIRAHLVRVSAEHHVLLVTQHHIVSDGWSVGVLVRELSALYAAFCAGSADPLPALPLQYADYAAWQRHVQRGDAAERQLAFWRGVLAGAPAVLTLPCDRPRPPRQSHAGGCVAFRLPRTLGADLRAFARRHDATLFMAVVAGWAALLSRLSGQDDIVIGTPVANRRRPEFEPLIGLFVNTLALRVRLHDAPDAAALLAQVRAAALDAFDHADLPFEQVVEALQPARSLSHSPVFQTLVALNNTPGGIELTLPGLRVAPLPAAHATTRVDLSLALTESGGDITGEIEFAGDLFDRATVERYAGYFVRLLEGMVAEPQRTIRTLPLLDPRERQRVLAPNDADLPRPLAHRRFEAQAAQHPDRIALVCGDQSSTYRELDQRANRLARRLLAHGVRADDRVAICAARGIEAIVGILGTLKAGAAFLVLDPAQPVERLADMLADSRPAALLMQPGVGTAFEPRDDIDVAVPVLMLDDDAAGDDADAPLPEPSAAHLAYVIYTSGSTGRPKGALIEHGNLANLLAAWQALFPGFGSEAFTGSLWSRFGFDVSVIELFATLAFGGTLHIVPDAIVADPVALAEWFDARRIRCAYLPPHFVRQSSALYRDGGLQPPFDHVLVGVEALLEADLHRLQSARPCMRIANGYGPTETTVFCTAYTAIEDRLRNAPIGRPLPNARVYVLDADRQPVPVGVAGELYIGGACVGRGYLHRPELTAERYLDDPFSGVPGARMYRTGDVGRWLPTGDIEFLGRNDHQVKIRGFRIEPGEIEARLAGCDGVAAALVVAREDVPGDARLVAYVVPEPARELDAAVLRATLARALADYMVPGAFVVLPALPLTANGKVDRAALPAPAASLLRTREFAAPAGDTETALAALWEELLGVARIGRADHFFELGGHSLAFTKLGFGLKERFGVELKIAQLYELPVLHDMAAAIDAQRQRAQQARRRETTLVIDL